MLFFIVENPHVFYKTRAKAERSHKCSALALGTMNADTIKTCSSGNSTTHCPSNRSYTHTHTLITHSWRQTLTLATHTQAGEMIGEQKLPVLIKETNRGQFHMKSN